MPVTQLSSVLPALYCWLNPSTRPSYAEVSPSLSGVKIFFYYASSDLPALKAALGDNVGKTFKPPSSDKHPPAIELYLAGRYFTVTNSIIEGLAPAKINMVSADTILELIHQVGPAFEGKQARFEGEGAKRPASKAPIQGTGGSVVHRLLLELVPGGTLQGQEYKVPDPVNSGSVKFNIKNERWANFANGKEPSGHGLARFVAYMRGITTKEAALLVSMHSDLNLVGPKLPDDDPFEFVATTAAPTPADLSRSLDTGGPPIIPSHVGVYRHANGEIAGAVARYESKKKEGKPDKSFSHWVYGQRVSRDGAGQARGKVGWCRKGMPKPWPLYGLLNLLSRPEALVIIVEGEKTADHGAKLFKEFVFVTSAGGASSPQDTDWSWLRGRICVIWRDNDAPGIKYAAMVARLAFAAGAAEVLVVDIPKSWPEGWDIANPPPPGVTTAMLTKMIEGAKPAKAIILLSVGDLHTYATEAEDAIVKAGVDVFQRANKIVRPVIEMVGGLRSKKEIAAHLGELDVHGLMDVMSQTADWERSTPGGRKVTKVQPPKDVANVLLSRAGQWKFRQCSGIITTPTMRSDGTVITEPGYDPETGLILVHDPSLKLRLPEPTREAAEAAVKVLLSLLPEFPFIEDDGVSLSVALSGIITPVVRAAIDVVPLTVIRSHSPGSGKSYLMDIISAICTGRPCAVTTYGRSEEFDKKLTGLLLEGRPLICIDNCNEELGGDLLCQAVDHTSLELRRLGGSQMTRVKNQATCFANGNNMSVRGDMVRRTVVCDLDAKLERPELRKFKSEPVKKIIANRGKYVGAALTICRAYILAAPATKPASLGGFGEWSSLVRGALMWLGCADPVRSMEVARRDDPELGELREVLAAWYNGQNPLAAQLSAEGKPARRPEDGFTAKELGLLGSLKTDSDMETFGRLGAFKDVIMRIGAIREILDPRRLGRWLARYRGRIVVLTDDEKPIKVSLIIAGRASGGVVKWALKVWR
jgi:putative DNA primase/helicase